MHKLAHPVSIFSLVVLGLIFVMLKTKFSILLDFQSSYIFAFGIFLISFGLGLILYNYLVSDFVSMEVSANKEKQNLETKKQLNIQQEQIKPQKIENQVVNAPLLLVQDQEQKQKEELLNKESVENQSTNTDISKIDKILLHLSIDKENVLKLLNKLNSELYLEQKKQKKNILNSRIISFFAIVAILGSSIFLVFFFANYNLFIFVAVGFLVLFSLFFIFKAQIIKKKSQQSIDNLAQRIQNLTFATKRFRAISQANNSALKNTINSLSDENKREIVTKIIK